ncbi:MAG: AraC family transcriptional regulator [Microbacterium sp.]
MSDESSLRPAPLPSERGDHVEPTPQNFSCESLVVSTEVSFPLHFHSHDQLAWMAGGAMVVEAAGTRWHVRGDHFVWIPAGILHEMTFTSPGELINVYTDERLRPQGARWMQPSTMSTNDLAESILWHLVQGPQSLERTSLCLRLLHGLLQETDVRHDTLAVPADSRAAAIAAALLADPSDPRELGDWAEQLGVSERTLARAFVADGTTFRQWRRLARTHAAAAMLQHGRSVADVAARVGYATPSGFITAFSERFGVTPAAYARRLRHRASAIR